MTSTLPAPLVAAFVDLSNFEFMPLDVRRIRDSKIAAGSSGDEFRAAVLLWCAAWHQVPAASVPNDDVELAQLAGYGRSIKEWRKIKPGALHGWILCSDGRWYHKVVSEKALEAWDQKVMKLHNQECDRLRKENAAREKDGKPKLEMPPKPPRNSGRYVASMPVDFQTNSAGKSDGIPAEKFLKGIEQTGIDLIIDKEALAPAPESEPAPPVARAEASAGKSEAEVMDEARAIGRAFGDTLDAVYGNSAMRTNNPTDEIHCASRWVRELGMTSAMAAAIFEAEMRSGVERGKAPIRSMRYLDGRIREAAAKNTTATAILGQAVQEPATFQSDPERSRWVLRVRGFKESGFWLSQWGEPPIDPMNMIPVDVLAAVYGENWRQILCGEQPKTGAAA